MYEYNIADKPIFNAAFDASRPPAVRAVRHMEDYAARLNAAMNLAKQGQIMIEAIDVEAMDPYSVMYLWQYVSKWPWQPSLLQPKVLLGPGETYPGLPNFDPTPPPGSVIVKCNMDTLLTDYPPFDPPAPPAPNGATYITHAFLTPMGWTIWFTKA